MGNDGDFQMMDIIVRAVLTMVVCRCDDDVETVQEDNTVLIGDIYILP